MKTITCKALGGPCDAPLSANSYDEMMKAGWAHVEEAHPDMAAKIKNTPKDDPEMVKWEKNFKKTWAKTPDNK